MTEIRKYLESKKDEMIALLAELVAIRSIAGEPVGDCPFGEESAKALEIMLKRCSEYGFSVENVDNYAGSADINDLEPSLAILSHLDVVLAGTGWSKGNPYVLRQEGDKLIGRGAIDDKGPAVASVFAARAVKELGFPIKKGVRLIFGTNEENGFSDMEYYCKKRKMPPMVFTPDGEYPIINGEKGMLRVWFSAKYYGEPICGGTVINAVPSNCFAGACEFKGVSAHASTPEKGENAITKFLEKCQDDDPLLKNLAGLFPHGEFDGSSCGMGYSDDISGKMTCVLSMLHTVGDTLKGGIDIRFPLNRTKAEVSRKISAVLELAGFTVDSCDGVEPHYTDENSDFVQSLLRVYERVTGEKGECLSIGGGTYVHEIEGGVAFGAEFPGEDCRMHSPDEFITIDTLLKNAEIMAEAIVELTT